MSAMRFLNLIDANTRPMPRLKLLVTLHREKHRAALMRQVAEEAYAFVFKRRYGYAECHLRRTGRRLPEHL